MIYFFSIEFLVLLAAALVALVVFKRLKRSVRFGQTVSEIVEPSPDSNEALELLEKARLDAEYQANIERLQARASMQRAEDLDRKLNR